MFRYTDWKGERKQKCKRGFTTRVKALEWESEFLQPKRADMDMTFESFVELYEKDIQPHLKQDAIYAAVAESAISVKDDLLQLNTEVTKKRILCPLTSLITNKSNVRDIVRG